MYWHFWKANRRGAGWERLAESPSRKQRPKTATNKPAEAPEVSVLVNRTSGRVLSENVRVASGGWATFIGLMGRSVMPGEILGLPRCAAVHTFFVRQPLDIAFCDQEGRVLRIVGAVRPFRAGPSAWGAAMAWEARAGTLAPWVAPGDTLECL